jgi:hypothetical protein
MTKNKMVQLSIGKHQEKRSWKIRGRRRDVIGPTQNRINIR